MRIISGIYKSRAIEMPKGIRPTQNKVRKALFDILGDIEGLSFLELFAGTGAVGFEALSRQAGDLTLVENKPECIFCIEKNIKNLRLINCNLLKLDAEKAIETLEKHKKSFDIVFFDPPYYKDMAKKILQIIGAHDILAPNGLIIVQHSKRDKLSNIEEDLSLFKQAKYGDTLLSFYNHIKLLNC
ncbi:MAG: 16S rRNA (guanine(966)-N(2))-methyltransferase RsmD [Candidatus Omnitrophota bacterium]